MSNAGVRDAIEDLKHRIEDERVPGEDNGSPAAQRSARRRTLIVGVALVAAAGIGLAVAAVGSSPSKTTLAGYLGAHVPAGTRIGVTPGAPTIPSGYPTVPINSATGLIAAQPHWMLVANPPGSDSATAWTIQHGTLAVSTPEGRLYSVVPPARPPAAKPPAKPPAAHHPTPAPHVTTPAPTTPSVGTAFGTVTVAAGDNFWTIATNVVAQHIGHAPSNAQVFPEWQSLVSANANRLVHPGDPNLVYPGQVLLVPPA